jgi:hypothetical protein
MKLIENCKSVYPFFKDVFINDDSLSDFISVLREQVIPLPTWKDDFCFQGDPEKTLDWIFLFNSINFSFWNEPRWHTTISGIQWGTDDEAFGVMASLAHAIQSGVPLNDYNYLKTLDCSDLSAIFASNDKAGPLPMLEQRLEGLLEMGMAFHRFGNAAGILKMCDYSAPKLAAFLVSSCPSWNDSQTYKGTPLPFHKRAWLCCAMVYERFIDDYNRRLTEWEHIPVFADYRLPQALRDLGILEYSATLAQQIDHKLPIPSESKQEIEIRASTILVAEKIYTQLSHLSPLQIDAYLWTYAVQKDQSIAPHHRTRTIRY